MHEVNLNDAVNRILVGSEVLKLDNLSLMVILCVQNGIIPHIKGLNFIYGKKYIDSLTTEQEAELSDKILSIMGGLMGYGLISLESK